MTVEQIREKWKMLPDKSETDSFRSVLLSPQVPANIFIGVNSSSHRCLILSLPITFKKVIQSVIKENLTIEYFQESNYIVLRLTDGTYFDLFDDLILSLMNRVKNLEDVEKYTSEFINTFFKWSDFFDDRKLFDLSESAIKGLLGELSVLRSLIIESEDIGINIILESWKGPYNHKHDFVLESKCIEVKTKDISSLDIKISSEFQLMSDEGKGLELSVINLQFDPVRGVTIKELSMEIKSLIIDRMGDPSIFFKALLQLGITNKNIGEYDIFRFLLIDEVRYDCNADHFPKLTNSNIPKQINGVRYSIRLLLLNDFVINKQLFSNGN